MLKIDVDSMIDKSKVESIQWNVKAEDKKFIQNFMKKYNIQFTKLFSELAEALKKYETESQSK